MKVSLVVAQGVHAGKAIPIAPPQFLIGRDPECNLRPASPAISKKHCGIFIREGNVFVQDYGSTNGTAINGEPVKGECEVASGDNLKVGPLEFQIKIEATASQSTIKAAPAKAATIAVAAPVAVAQTAVPVSAGMVDSRFADDPDQAAAMFLAMDESGALDPTAEARVPDGTTVMEIPAVPGTPTAGDKSKKEQADTSKAAADLLSKYMRRPRA